MVCGMEGGVGIVQRDAVSFKVFYWVRVVACRPFKMNVSALQSQPERWLSTSAVVIECSGPMADEMTARLDQKRKL